MRFPRIIAGQPRAAVQAQHDLGAGAECIGRHLITVYPNVTLPVGRDVMPHFSPYAGGLVYAAVVISLRYA